MSEQHFVTTIEVKKVTVNTASPYTTAEPKRSVTTIARLVISGKTLDAVKEKAAAHLELIEDGGDIQ